MIELDWLSRETISNSAAAAAAEDRAGGGTTGGGTEGGGTTAPGAVLPLADVARNTGGGTSNDIVGGGELKSAPGVGTALTWVEDV